MKGPRSFDTFAIDTIPYPVLVAGHYHMRSRYHIIRPNGTHDWLIFLTAAGAGRFQDGDRTVKLERDQLAVYPPGVRHDYRTDPATGFWDLRWAHFRPTTDWLPLLAWERPEPDRLRILDIGGFAKADLKEIRSCFRLAVDEATHPGVCADLLAMNHLERALLLCQRGIPQNMDSSAALEKARTFIRAHYAAEIDFTALARDACRTLPRFEHDFRLAFGASPRAFAEWCRMQAAMRLAAMGEQSVKLIACSVGFDDPLYFSRRFRKFFNQTPRQVITAQKRPAPRDPGA